MTDHWVYAYIGTAPKSCAHLVLDIQRNEFNRSPNIGIDDYTYQDREKIFEDVKAVEVSERELQEGDIVLMSGNQKNDHIGTIVDIDNHLFILHFLNGIGVSCTPVRWIKCLPGINIEKYYRIT